MRPKIKFFFSEGNVRETTLGEKSCEGTAHSMARKFKKIQFRIVKNKK